MLLCIVWVSLFVFVFSLKSQKFWHGSAFSYKLVVTVTDEAHDFVSVASGQHAKRLLGLESKMFTFETLNVE